nr:protein EMBRYO DEFECTIVE 1674 isoform X1 [Ipomoea batatas]
MEKFRAVPNHSRQNFTAISSSFLKEVYLCDWWLIKFSTNSKSERIGVAGFTFRESQDARIFHSAAISKRIDTVTLEAVDGIVIVVSGCINRSRTIQNGFPFEVFMPFYCPIFATRRLFSPFITAFYYGSYGCSAVVIYCFSLSIFLMLLGCLKI